ncbi:Zinc metalloproteinase nas-12 [Trichostrongylus colubriformis]|uniref:Metalloendopeptidase n=1 Tax=Trichostrongylus colubriformis TaxID=6319 RepID=A0AAN8FVL1_TRICO
MRRLIVARMYGWVHHQWRILGFGQVFEFPGSIQCVLTPLQRRRYETQKNPVRGVSRKESAVNRWYDNIIPYTLSSQYSDEQKKTIRNSLDGLQRISCFRFVQRSEEQDFLAFMPLDGCYSFVGKVGGSQVLSLAVDCIADYIIWHEVMHAIGFEHEHQRPDRDKFIRVEYSNVQQGQLANFEKLSPYEVDYPDPYDYNSIMHYDSHAFGRRDPSTHLRLATMIPLKKGVTLDDNLKMSESDILKLNRLGTCTDPKGSTKEEENSTCVDTALNCARLKKHGLCSMSSHVQTMLKYCPKTCHLCGLRSANSPGSSKENSTLLSEELSNKGNGTVAPDCKDNVCSQRNLLVSEKGRIICALALTVDD